MCVGIGSCSSATLHVWLGVPRQALPYERHGAKKMEREEEAKTRAVDGRQGPKDSEGGVGQQSLREVLGEGSDSERAGASPPLQRLRDGKNSPVCVGGGRDSTDVGEPTYTHSLQLSGPALTTPPTGYLAFRVLDDRRPRGSGARLGQWAGGNSWDVPFSLFSASRAPASDRRIACSVWLRLLADGRPTAGRRQADGRPRRLEAPLGSGPANTAGA